MDDTAGGRRSACLRSIRHGRGMDAREGQTFRALDSDVFVRSDHVPRKLWSISGMARGRRIERHRGNDLAAGDRALALAWHQIFLLVAAPSCVRPRTVKTKAKSITR